MSLEKGINRLGTVFGVMLGCFFVFVAVLVTLNFGYSEYFSEKYPKPYPVYTTKYYIQTNLPDVWKLIEKDMEEKAAKGEISREDFLLGLYAVEESKHWPILEKINRDQVKPNKFISVYLPTTGLWVLIISISFLVGLYMFKGMTKTLNWIIKGFRE